MIERLLFVGVLFVIGYVMYKSVKQRQIRKTSEMYIVRDPVLAHFREGKPAIVYFTTPQCIPCKTIQRPALDLIEKELGVQVFKIDATEDPDAAERWGVMSVPTTFILDSTGVTRDVNNGVADANKLKRQLSVIDVEPPVRVNPLTLKTEKLKLKTENCEL
jgi:thiol-disulfide isomerase/thioredoxin